MTWKKQSTPCQLQEIGRLNTQQNTPSRDDKKGRYQPPLSLKKTLWITQRRFTANEFESYESMNYRDDFLKCLFEEYFKRIATKDWTTLTCFEQNALKLTVPHLNIFAMSGAQQKTQSCIKLYGLCVWQTQTMNEWNFKKEWPRCTAWSIFSKNHRLLSVTAYLTTTLWCVFIEKASRPHDHVSAKKKQRLISHRNHDLILPQKWVQLNPNGIRETKNIFCESNTITKPYICINILCMHIYIYICYICAYTHTRFTFIVHVYIDIHSTSYNIGKPIDIRDI